MAAIALNGNVSYEMLLYDSERTGKTAALAPHAEEGSVNNKPRLFIFEQSIRGAGSRT
jgi:hypothetical protein